jgi:hypothetical protein
MKVEIRKDCHWFCIEMLASNELLLTITSDD